MKWAHQQLGLAQLQKIEADVAEFGTVEQMPKMEGRQMGMLLGPKKKNSNTHEAKKALHMQGLFLCPEVPGTLYGLR